MEVEAKNIHKTRRFYLWRTEDVSGVSGTGHIADGAVFEDGTTVLKWRNSFTVSIFRSYDEIINIHGHEGRTILRWID